MAVSKAAAPNDMSYLETRYGEGATSGANFFYNPAST